MNALAALLKKDWRVLLNLKRLAREQSKFKIGFILIFALGLLSGLGILFYEGFRFLSALGGIGLMIIRHLFAIFFFGLGMMLTISNVITAYTAMFRSDEIPSLMLRPVAHGHIVLHKLLETTLLSSWAFFFIIIPFVGAYALHEGLSPLFVIWTFLFSIPFVMLCAIAGTLIALPAVRWMPTIHPGAWISGGVLVFAWLLLSARGARGVEDEVSFVMARLVPGMRIASYPLLPSWWVAEGIMASSRGMLSRASLLMGVLVSNVLFFGMLTERVGNALFYPAWQRVLAARRRTRARTRPLSWPGRHIPFVPADAAAIALKDFRSLLRDPVQWTQGLLFFGLLGLYFFNLRNLQYHLLSPVWRNLIAFLNVFSLSAVMCSFCSRFVYPQMSLEGHGFWILGLSPTGMGRVLVIKFGGALAGMLFISIALTSVSMLMLGVERDVLISALLIAVAMSFALSGLATGLGAAFLDLKQRNPAAIISGFGGTLNLALSLVFMTLAILPFGALYHAFFAGHIGASALRRGLIPATGWLVLLTAFTTLLPLAAGRRSLLDRDY